MTEQKADVTLKADPRAVEIALAVAGKSQWKSGTDNYARIYQAAYAGAIAAWNARPADDVVEAQIADAIRSAYLAGAEDVHQSWVDETNEREPDFAEAASDYANSIDVAALAKAGESA